MPERNEIEVTLPVIHPISGQIGAEVIGVSLAADLATPVFVALHEALLRHKVLFFRGQHDLDDEAQQRLGRRFGELVEHPTQPSRAGTSILELDTSRGGGRADRWHTDVTFVDAYPAITILRSVVAPERGGDTVWANTEAAYADLPEPLKALAEGLRAVHSNLYDYAAERPRASDADRRAYEEVFTSTVHETEHPVVHVHPVTGARSLILGQFIRRFVGHSREQSDLLFQLLQSHATRLEYTVRWRWQPGDLALWDNRATQHIAVNDYGDQQRVVRRVTVAGVAPVGVDGRRSVTLRQAPKFAAAAE
jgi:taurine dioxygenase